MSEPQLGVTRQRKSYQCDVRRKCDCGGSLKKFEHQLPGKLELFCLTCHRMWSFTDISSLAVI